jgi:hypothetical protein
LKGLVIKSPWIEKILLGEKTWEIRGSRTNIRGRIALIKSGSKTLLGSAELVDCIPLYGPNNGDLLLNNFDKHRVPLGGVTYEKPHAWVLDHIISYLKPISYSHPQGAVIWVDLTDQLAQKVPAVDIK